MFSIFIPTPLLVKIKCLHLSESELYQNLNFTVESELYRKPKKFRYCPNTGIKVSMLRLHAWHYVLILFV